MAYLICEPLTDLPQKFNIEALIKEQYPELDIKQKEVKEKSVTDFLWKDSKKYVVLPSFNHQLDHLKPYLSLQKDKYMGLRWKKFLDNVPDHYVTINLYTGRMGKSIVPRKKTLNGLFYGVDYKLAPIPVAPDPRTYLKQNARRLH